jgi:hypothetical protein
MMKTKNVVKITSNYSYATTHQKVIEVDQNDATTLLFTKSTYTVSKGMNGAQAYHFSSVDTYPAKSPIMPVTNHC